MKIKPYGYIQLVPPVLDAVAEGDLDNIENWKNIGLCSIDPNLWGLRAFKGSREISGKSVMKATRGASVSTETKMDLRSVSLPSYHVIAYHEFIYGDKPWSSYEHHPSTLEQLKLPLRVRDLPQVVAYTSYSIERYNTGINLAYDIWITRSSTSRECFEGDIELMVWLFSDMGIRPAGEVVAELDLPVLVDGEVYDAKWYVWVYPRMQNRWLYIAFVLSRPVKRGSVAVDLSRIISEMKNVLISKYPGEWSRDGVDDMYVRAIELGTEVFYSPAVDLEWHLSEYYLVTLPMQISSRKVLQSIVDTGVLLRD